MFFYEIIILNRHGPSKDLSLYTARAVKVITFPVFFLTNTYTTRGSLITFIKLNKRFHYNGLYFNEVNNNKTFCLWLPQIELYEA